MEPHEREAGFPSKRDKFSSNDVSDKYRPEARLARSIKPPLLAVGSELPVFNHSCATRCFSLTSLDKNLPRFAVKAASLLKLLDLHCAGNSFIPTFLNQNDIIFRGVETEI